MYATLKNFNFKIEKRGCFIFYVSFFQIYNEQVYDLLNFDVD